MCVIIEGAPYLSKLMIWRFDENNIISFGNVDKNCFRFLSAATSIPHFGFTNSYTLETQIPTDLPLGASNEPASLDRGSVDSDVRKMRVGSRLTFSVYNDAGIHVAEIQVWKFQIPSCVPISGIQTPIQGAGYFGLLDQALCDLYSHISLLFPDAKLKWSNS